MTTHLCSPREVSDVLYCGPLEVGHHAVIPEGHSPHQSGHSVLVCNPGGLILNYVGSIHHCHCGSYQCIWLLCFWGSQWGPERVNPSIGRLQPPEAWRWCYLWSRLGGPSNSIKSDSPVWPLCILWLIDAGPFFPCTLAVASPPQLTESWRGPPVGITGQVGSSTSIQPGMLLCGTSPFSPFLHCTGACLAPQPAP